MEKADLAGWAVNRVGLSTIGFKTSSLWADAALRATAVRMIRRAAQLGAEVIEVPVPFGPWADLIKEAAPDAMVAVARMTAPIHHPFPTARQLGIPVAALVAEPHLLEDAAELELAPVGVIAGPTAVPSTFGAANVHAVRGPYPPARRILEWCLTQGMPYLAGSVDILAAGPNTIAVPAPQTPANLERVFKEAAAIPPAAGPG